MKTVLNILKAVIGISYVVLVVMLSHFAVTHEVFKSNLGFTILVLIMVGFYGYFVYECVIKGWK